MAPKLNKEDGTPSTAEWEVYRAVLSQVEIVGDQIDFGQVKESINATTENAARQRWNKFYKSYKALREGTATELAADTRQPPNKNDWTVCKSVLGQVEIVGEQIDFERVKSEISATTANAARQRWNKLYKPYKDIREDAAKLAGGSAGSSAGGKSRRTKQTKLTNQVSKNNTGETSKKRKLSGHEDEFKAPQKKARSSEHGSIGDGKDEDEVQYEDRVVTQPNLSYAVASTNAEIKREFHDDESRDLTASPLSSSQQKTTFETTQDHSEIESIYEDAESDDQKIQAQMLLHDSGDVEEEY